LVERIHGESIDFAHYSGNTIANPE
jgi:hypothetical protein